MSKSYDAASLPMDELQVRATAAAEWKHLNGNGAPASGG